MIPARDMVRGLSEPDLEVDLSDIEPNVYDVYNDVPDDFSVKMEGMTAESLCSPVVIQTRPQGGCDPVVPLRKCQGHDFLTKIGPEVVVSGRESINSDPDVRDEICGLPDQLPVVVPMSAAVPLAASVVAQTRPRGVGGSNLLLPVDMSIEPLDDDGSDVISSGRESTVMKSDVSHDICVDPDQLPVVVSKVAVEPLGLPGVALTTPQVGGTPVVAWPAHEDTISQVEVDQDLLLGRIMKSVDPDETSGDCGSLMAVPAVDRDACHTEWRETVVDEMEEFVLIPEVCPVVFMASATEPAVWPALSEEYSPVVLAGGGGGAVAAAYPLAVVESDTVRVSVLSVVGNELLAVLWGRSPWMWSVGAERWPVVSPSGFGGNPASFAGRAKHETLYSSGHIPGWWTYGESFFCFFGPTTRNVFGPCTRYEVG